MIDPNTITVGSFVLVTNDDGDSATYEVTKAPWKLGHGAWVLGLKGICGGYSLDRVVEAGGLCAICRRIHARMDRSACEKCVPLERDANPERTCVPNGFGLCSTHPVCSVAERLLEMFDAGLLRGHALHLAAWAQHCAEICMPLQIMAREDEE